MYSPIAARLGAVEHLAMDQDKLTPTNGHPRTGAPALVTAHGLEQLRAARERLRHSAGVEITEGLRDARSYGEGSNNDEHHAVLEERMVLEARIALLDQHLSRVVVVDPQQAAEGAAAIGATVVLEDLTSGSMRRYRIAGAHALDPGTISAASPMGQALLGEAAGKVVTVELPNSRQRSVRLLAVEHSAEGQASGPTANAGSSERMHASSSA